MSGPYISIIVGIAGIWLLLFLFFSGIGILIRRSFGLEIKDMEALLTDFWLGWAASIVFLQIWHLFIRVDWRAFLVIVSIGICGLSVNRKAVWHVLRKYAQINWPFYIILLIAGLWLASRAMLAPTIYDTGLYHLPSVRWITSSAIVPGLGNLSGYLAFNSSFFLYVAMLVSVLGWESYHLASGILVLTLCAQIFLSYHKLFKRNNGPAAGNIFYALLLGPVLYLIFYINISNPTPDIPVFILGILLAAQLMILFEKGSSFQREDGYRMFFIAALAAVGITLKQSFFVIGTVTILLLFLAIRRRKTVKAAPLLCLGATLAVLLFWLIRGVILSGYIAFPFPLGSFPVEWRVPYADALNMARSVSNWARIPFAKNYDVALGNWGWFMPWAIRVSHNSGMAVCIIWALAGYALLLFYKLSGRHKKNPGCMTALFLLPWLIYIPIWFFTAPNPRYLGSALCILGAGAFAIVFNNYGLIQKRVRFNMIFVLYILVCSLFFTIKLRDNRDLIKVTHVELAPFLTDSGLAIYVPKEGDQCWDAPLPCAPGPVKNLRLRRKENIYYGFMAD